jgi:hypothetical protein
MIPIHEPRGNNAYCGPSVLSMLTGESSNEDGNIMKSLRHISGRRTIKGYHVHHIVPALDQFGFAPTVAFNAGRNSLPRHQPLDPRLTLNQWLDTTCRVGRTFVVASGTGNNKGHYFIVQGDRYFDRPFGFDINIRTAPQIKRRGRMIAAIEVNPKPVPSAADLLALLGH